MKNTIIRCLIGSTALLACNNLRTKTQDVRDFIPGVYVRTINSEYATGTDTLFLTAIHGNPNTYGIIKHATVKRTLNGKPLPPEYINSRGIGIYDEHAGMLQDQRTGKLMRFEPDSARLFIGTSPYQKIAGE